MLGNLSAIIDGFQGLTMMSQGAGLAQEGSAYSARQFRSAGSLAITGAQYRADSFRLAGDMAISGAAYEKQVIESAKKINTKGAEYQATTLINAGNAAVAAARYNKSLDEVETDQTLNLMGRQIRSTFSANNSIIANSGVSSTSKSYLSVMDDAMSTYENQVTGIRSASKLRQREMMHQGNLTATEYLNAANGAIYASKIANYNLDNEIAASDYQARIAKYSYYNQATAAEFEGSVDAWRYEGQARQAEYEGEVADYQYKVSMAQAIGGAVGKLGSLF